MIPCLVQPGMIFRLVGIQMVNPVLDAAQMVMLEFIELARANIEPSLHGIFIVYGGDQLR